MALAAKLTESGRLTVLLLEAGGRDKDSKLHVPAAFSQLFRTQYDWSYDTEPQEHLDHRRIYWPRGKVLGGSSSLNAMMWVRGFAADYDEWAELAGPQWSWDALPPGGVDGRELRQRSRHGRRRQRRTAARPPASDGHLLRAVREAGYPVEAANTLTRAASCRPWSPNGEKRGRAPPPHTLKPARRRGNLTIRTEAHVTRVLFDGRRDRGRVPTGRLTALREGRPRGRAQRGSGEYAAAAHALGRRPGRASARARDRHRRGPGGGRAEPA